MMPPLRLQETSAKHTKPVFEDSENKSHTIKNTSATSINKGSKWMTTVITKKHNNKDQYYYEKI